jgi:hypothetical protein
MDMVTKWRESLSTNSKRKSFAHRFHTNKELPNVTLRFSKTVLESNGKKSFLNSKDLDER